MEYVQLGDLIVAAKTNRCGDNDFPVLSITKNDGIVLQSEKFKKRIASKDTADYKIVRRGQLVQGIHIDEANFGIQEVADSGIVSPAYKIWDIKSNAIVPRYLEIVLRSPISIAYYASKFNGSIKRRERLSDKDFLQMRIPCPTIDEQLYAIDVLDKTAILIDQRKQQLSELDNLIKARFVEMFDSDSWDTVRAGSIMFDMRNGISPSNKGSHPAKVLTLSAFTQGAFDAEAWKEGLFDFVPPKEKRVVSSDFYMCRGNGNKKLVGAGVYSTEDRYDLIFPDTVIAASVDQQRVCLPYLSQAWKQPSVRKQIEQGARTTNGTYKINQGVVASIEIKLPPRELQQQFAAFVEQVDKSKVVVQKALDEAQTLFDSLMQQYFG